MKISQTVLELQSRHYFVTETDRQTDDQGKNKMSPNPTGGDIMISLKSDHIHIFNDFIHIYSPGAKAENPLGTNFWCQQKALITSTICCKFQTNLFEFWFYTHFLMFFHMYIAPGQGQTTLCGQNPDVNRKALSICPFVASFKNISLKSDFIHNFSCFLYMYIAPGQGQTTPWGQNLYKHKPHVYSPGAGQTTLCGQNPDVNRKALSLCPFVASFIFEVWFYT